MIIMPSAPTRCPTGGGGGRMKTIWLVYNSAGSFWPQCRPYRGRKKEVVCVCVYINFSAANCLVTLCLPLIATPPTYSIQLYTVLSHHPLSRPQRPCSRADGARTSVSTVCNLVRNVHSLLAAVFCNTIIVIFSFLFVL